MLVDAVLEKYVGKKKQVPVGTSVRYGPLPWSG